MARDPATFVEVERDLWSRFGISPSEHWVRLRAGNEVRVQEVGTGPPVVFRTLLGPDDRGDSPTYFGEFTHEIPAGARWAGNLGAVTLERGSAFSELLGEEFAASVNGDAVGVRVTVFRDTP